MLWTCSSVQARTRRLAASHLGLGGGGNGDGEGGRGGEMRGSLRTTVADAGVTVSVAARGTEVKLTTQVLEAVTVTVLAKGP